MISFENFFRTAGGEKVSNEKLKLKKSRHGFGKSDRKKWFVASHGESHANKSQPLVEFI
jgi:hypothetical protein